MSTQPRTASVVIPAFHADSVLGLQLEALARQVGAPDFEVIVADNGGNTGLDAIVEPWRDRLGEVRVVPAYGRRGAAYARNVGATAARTDLLLFCDADDVVLPNWVSRGVDLLREIPVFSGGAIPVDESEFSHGVNHILALVAAPDRVRALPLSGARGYPILMGGSFGIRRELFEELGGFDVGFGSAAEDNDLAFRIVEAGHTLYDASHVAIAYRVRSDSGTWSRGLRAGLVQARLCARHDAWDASPAYHGRWYARPLRTLAEALVQPASMTPKWREELGRQVGVAWGRVVARRVPRQWPDGHAVGFSEGASFASIAAAPQASVIIPCYNAAQTIGGQLQALTEQQDAPSFEVIVVVNGCTDDTEHVVRQFAAEHSSLDVRVVESPKGRCRARNLGAVVARAPIIAFCDADDQVFPDWLRRLYDRTFELHGIVGGAVVHKFVNSEAVMRTYGVDPDEGDPADQPPRPRDNFSWPRSAAEGNFAAWRADYLRLGGMDSSFVGGLEGDDLGMRAFFAGIPVNDCPQARIHYWLRPTPTGSYRQQRGLALAKMLFFVRYYDTGYCAGASLRYSMLGVLRGLTRLPMLNVMGADERQRFLFRFGGHVGSLEGHLRFRILRRVPAPETLPVGLGLGKRATLGTVNDQERGH